MSRLYSGSWLCLSLLLLPVGLADPVAVLVRSQGEVRLQRAGATAAAPAQVGSQLMAGDLVTPSKGGRAVLLFHTGKVQSITVPTRVIAPAGPARSSTFSQTVKTLAQVANTDAREKPNRSGMIRPIPGSTEPIAPRNGLTILDRRPSFSWIGIPGAKAYTLILGRAGQPPQRFEVGADTSWTLPATHPTLVAGETYYWAVGPSGDGRVSARQDFRVASQQQRAEIQKRLSGLRAIGLSPESEGIFLTALAYRDAGLWYEVAAVLDRMSRANPSAGPFLHQLRGEAYDELGNLDAAAREFELARRADGAVAP